MTITPDALVLPEQRPGPGKGWRERFRSRRRLREQDRHSARQAELHQMSAVAADAAELVAAGWLQHGWFARRDPNGQRHVATSMEADEATDWPVVEACLVGAVVQAGGGPAAAGGQLVRRTLELTWHTLYRETAEPLLWCPAPHVRIGHIRDLVLWNDQPGRTRSEVSDLLRATAETARGLRAD